MQQINSYYSQTFPARYAWRFISCRKDYAEELLAELKLANTELLLSELVGMRYVKLIEKLHGWTRYSPEYRFSMISKISHYLLNSDEGTDSFVLDYDPPWGSDHNPDEIYVSDKWHFKGLSTMHSSRLTTQVQPVIDKIVAQ